MKRNLEVSSVLQLKNDNNITDFCIEEVVGIGGSCIAYKVSYCESQDIVHKGILKEFCPAYLNEGDQFARDGQALVVPTEYKEQFAYDLEKFVQVYRDINAYLSENLSAANYHTVQLGLYEGNNTFYTLTSCDYGKSYDKVLDTDIYTALKLVLSVTKAVELYHNAGFLHLDIKPKNVLILDEVADIVKLFDFDSLTAIESLKGRYDVSIPIPEDYYVPELDNCDIRNIGIHTDIFEIGAMLFSRLFGRSPEVSEMQRGVIINLQEVELLTGVSPQAKYELQQLFSKTIQISKRNRYQTTSELKAQLCKIIELVSPNGLPYLLNLPKWQPSAHCIGRDQEIKEIQARLESTGYVFVKAIGGLGKSEVSKLFAQYYADDYHTVQFCKYNDSLKSVVASLPINGIKDDDYTDFDELVREKNKVLHLADQHTLLIVDNFNVTHDDFLRDFLPANNKSFKVIFTTRCQPAANYYEDKVYELSHLSMDECKYLFSLHSKTEDLEENSECLERIIKTIDYNTLVLVLLAATVKKTGISLEEMHNKLDNQKLDDMQEKVFHEYDFSSAEIASYNRINAHLNAIFSVSRLSNIEKEILKNMTLISYQGIGVSDFVSYCASSAINDKCVKSLINHGWIEKKGDAEISMHPIISDLLATNENVAKAKSYYNLAEQLEEFCNPDYLSHISIVMSRLSYAIQLEKRYRSEPVDKQALMKSKLGRLYANIYRPDDARKFLLDALTIAKDSKVSYFLPYIYSFLGEVEKDFGTYSAAIEYYNLSVVTGKSIKYRYYEIALESMINIAGCYFDNNELTKAYDQYKAALRFARMHFKWGHIYEIASGLVEVCNALDWLDKAQKYEELKSKYTPEDNLGLVPEEITKMQAYMEDGDFTSSMQVYEEFLALKREELGEDSPIYKDIAQSRWIFFLLHNDKEQAMRLATENLNFIESTHGKESMEMARQLSLIASSFQRIGEFEYATESAKRAIKICEGKKELHSYAYFEAKLALAQCYLLVGKLSEAKSVIESVELTDFTGNEALSDYVTSAGLVLCELSEYEKVEQLCNDLLGKSKMQKFAFAQASIMLAIVYEQRGELDKATEHAENAFNHINGLKTQQIKKEWLIQYYRAVARISFRRGDSKAAIDKINELLDLFSEDEKKQYLIYVPIMERALYHAQLGDIKKSEDDYALCEKILKTNNMPEESFAMLYNNVAKNHLEAGNYIIAKNYLDKLIAIRPSVMTPSSYFDAIVCNNIGWTSFNLEELGRAEEYYNKSIKTFEKIGATNTTDYLTTLHNFALLLEKRGDSSQSVKIYKRIFKSYAPDKDVTGSSRTLFVECCIRNMFTAGMAKEAYEFCCQENEYYRKRFGENSPERINLLLLIGSTLKGFGYTDCFEFFKYADDAIERGNLKESIYDARLQNYIGVCLADFDNEFGWALNRFRTSKELFEKLNAETDPLYPIVLSNIKYAEDKNMDRLISELAKSMKDENESD